MNPDRKNKLLEKVKWFSDMFLLSLLFLITSLPVVTLGASAAALYYSISKVEFHGEGYLFRTYWKAWKDNLRYGIRMTLVFFVFIALAVSAIIYLQALTAEGKIPAWLYGISWLLLLPPVITVPWVFQYIAFFNDTPGNVIRNSFTIGMTNIVLTVMQVLMWSGFTVCLFFFLPVLPFILASVSSKVFERTEPVLIGIAKRTDGYDENGWYNRQV